MDYSLILFFIADAIVDIWEEFNRYAINLISTQIALSEQYMDMDGWQLYLAVQSANITKKIKQKLTKTLLKSNKQIIELFYEIIEKTYIIDKETLKEQGVEIAGMTQTKALQKKLSLLYKQTNGEIKNLTGSLAGEAGGIFTKACDTALLLSQSGLMSRSEAIIKAITEASGQGLYVTYPSGHKDKIEVAVRRAVQTGCAQASGATTSEICEENGINYVCVSSHLGARVSDDPIGDHEGWQGKVYKIRQDGKHPEIDLLAEKTGYDAVSRTGDPLGLFGYNCRHSMTPVPDPDLFVNRQPQYDSDENKRVYEATQKQRAMERTMRKTRRDIEAMEVVRDNATDDQTREAAERELQKLDAKFKRQQAEYAKFSEENGLAEQRERLAI